MEDTFIKLVNLCFAFLGCFFFGWILGIYSSRRKKKKKSKYSKCDCKDVNQCSKWCNAKHLFKKDSDRDLV
jgi:hypothetical protein